MRPYYFDFERYRWRGTFPPRDECSACRALAQAVKVAAALPLLWRKRVRQRRELAALDARMRRDIGVTSTEIAGEVSKPFWRA